MTDTPQLKAALRWIERGFIPYPAKSDSKSEFSRKSERYHQRAKLNAEWATWAWSGRFAASNVKIKPAPNTCIVDVDREGFQNADAMGLLAVITYTETTPDNGYRLVFTLPDGFGASMRKLILAPGVELFCEASNSGAMVAPSVTAKGEYVALDESFAPCPAPQCVLDAIAAEREKSKCNTLPDMALPEAPKDTKQRYAETALFRECARLKSIPVRSGNGRHDKLRDACVRLGSVLHLGLSETEAMSAIEQAVSHWADRNQNDDARTIRDGLAYGTSNPRKIEWKHAERDFDDGTKAIADYLAAAKRNGKIGRVTTATAHAVLGAMVAHSTQRHLFGAFVLSVRQIAEMIGSGRKTVCNAIHSLASAKILQKLSRDEVKYIKRCNPDGEILRPQQMANCYAFRPLTVLGMTQGEACRKGTVIANEGGSYHPDEFASYFHPSQSLLTVPFLHTLECSRTALGRSCAAVLVAIGNGANTRAALAHSTGLHPSTVKRAIVRLLTFGMVIHDESTGEYFMVDSERLQQALQIVRSGYSVAARALARATRHTKERKLQAEWLKWREARESKNEPRSYADFKESRQPFNVGSASAALPALRQQISESKRIREAMTLAQADYVRAMQSTTK